MPDFYNSNLITLKDENWLSRQRVAGKCVGKILNHLEKLITNKQAATLKDLEAEADRLFIEESCTATFKNYKGFPGSICLSVNKEMVHGIPSNYKLIEGDVVKFDLGATYQGAIADAARTAIFGQAKIEKHIELIESCRTALNTGIEAIQVGCRLGVIGNAIHKYVSAKTNFGLVTNYGGHGLDESTPHAPPFVSNKSSANEGVRIQPGLTLAIEPMLTIGSPASRVLDDGWTVVTDGINAHFEHSVFVHEDRVEILTLG